MSSLSTLPKGDSAWLLRKSIQRIMQQVSVLETNIGSSTTGNSANTQVIFNDNGTLRGDTGLTFNKTTDTLGTGRLTTSGDAIVCSSTGDFYVGTTLSPQFKVERATGAATISGDLTVDTSTLKVDSANDRVGIGTATPGGALEVFKNTNGQNRLFLNNPSTGTGAYDAIDFTAGTANNQILSMGSGYSGSFPYLTGALLLRSAQANGIVLNTAGSAAAIQFGINDTLGMTLNATGLGVGASAAQKLTVAGSAEITGGVVGQGALIGRDGSSGGATYSSNTGNTNVNAPASGSVRFNVNNGVFAGVFDANANLGIGVTPSASWASNRRAFQIGGLASGAVALNGTGGSGEIFFNSFFNTSTQNICVVTGGTGKYDFNVSTVGAHSWSVGTGTAGNAFTFTQAMTLDASGNLLVGNSGNPNTARAYFRYDTLTTQPVINSASIVAASTAWSHFIGQSGNGSSITTSNIFIYGNGNIQNINGVYGTISDLRLKENIADARNYLADLLKLRVVKYSLKEEASAVANKLGFIAQEVEQVFPAMVDTDPNDGNKGIKTSVLIPMLVKAIQELTARVQTLEAK